MQSIIPILDLNFQSAALADRAYLDDVKASGEAIPLLLATQRPNGSVSRFDTLVCVSDRLWTKRSERYLERLVKFLLWYQGAARLFIGGAPQLAQHINEVYSPSGARAFDHQFMGRVYAKPFEVISCGLDEVPAQNLADQALGNHLDGCRVGFDLGASDVKVSAVLEGEAIFSAELEWQPYTQADPAYHKAFIKEAIQLAASKLPRLDAIGGSAAGVYIDNQPRVASLFRGVPEAEYHRVNNLFNELAAEFHVPLVVINDGEVTALAGAMSLEDNGVLGLALGSSLAAGYVTLDGKVTDHLDELAFAPIDYNPAAPHDEWSQDIGVGASYLSQQAVFRLAKQIGLDIPPELTPAGKLKFVQEGLEGGQLPAQQIWETMGVYLGHAVAHYNAFYAVRHVLILGRVTSGSGGTILQEQAQKVLRDYFPSLLEDINIQLPDEKSRRVGQSIAAASLPEIRR